MYIDCAQLDVQSNYIVSFFRHRHVFWSSPAFRLRLEDCNFCDYRPLLLFLFSLACNRQDDYRAISYTNFDRRFLPFFFSFSIFNRWRARAIVCASETMLFGNISQRGQPETAVLASARTWKIAKIILLSISEKRERKKFDDYSLICSSGQ